MDAGAEKMPESEGGLGGAPPDGDAAAGTSRDTRLAERALRQRWPIPPEKRPAVINRLLTIIETKNASRREVTAAIRALAAIDALNMEQEKRDQNIPDRIDLTSGGKPLTDADKAIIVARVIARFGRGDAVPDGSGDGHVNGQAMAGPRATDAGGEAKA